MFVFIASVLDMLSLQSTLIFTSTLLPTVLVGVGGAQVALRTCGLAQGLHGVSRMESECGRVGGGVEVGRVLCSI